MINDQWLMKYLLLLFFPFLMKGQVTGVRTAYTFTNLLMECITMDL